MTLDDVQAAFRKVFKDSRIYGKHSFIIGKDPINRAMKKNIVQKFLEYENEVPLFGFSYNEFHEGLVITNMRIVWNYGDGHYSGDVDLEDIQRVEAGRSVLAKIMKIYDVTGKKYSDIYLTGMDEADKFVSQVNEFIAVLNGADDEDVSDWPTYDEDDTPKTSAPAKTQSKVANTADKNLEAYLEQLVNFCDKTFARAEFIFDGYIYHIGRDDKSNDKIKKAVAAYASLKNGEFPLVCCDVTAFGGAEDGFLMTNAGIHVHNPYEKTRYFPYESITSVELKGMFVKEVYINNFEIYSPAGFHNQEKENMANLFIYFRNTFLQK